MKGKAGEAATAGRRVPSRLALALAFLLLAGALAAAFPDASRGQGVDIAAVPSKLEFNIRPGAEQSQTVKIYNQGAVPTRVLAYVEDYSISPENQIAFFPGGTLDYSIASWVSFSESDFTLEPGGFREVAVRLSVPADATVGGYASLAVFEAHHPEEASLEGLVTVGRIGVPLLTTVAVNPSEIRQEGAIVSLEVEKGTWVLFRTDLRITTTFENLGNTYLHYHAFTDVTGGISALKHSEDHGESTALARTQRQITCEIKGAWFGRYRVRAEVHYPPDRVLVREQTVWVVPWLLIVILVAAALAFFSALYWRRRRRRRPDGKGAD